MGILTILPRPPIGSFDGGNDEFCKAFGELADDVHEIRYAGTIAELRYEISEYNRKGFGPPERIQIYAHGARGILELQSYWNDVIFDDCGNYFMLDGNPWGHGALAGVIQPGTWLMLLGCWTGDSGAGGIPGSGVSLAFDLAQLLGTTVSAPVRPIDQCDFDARGCFQDYLCLTTAQGHGIILGTDTSEAKTYKIEPLQNELSGVRGVALVSRQPGRAIVQPPGARTPAQGRFQKLIERAFRVQIVAPRAIRGSAEARFTADYSGKEFAGVVFGGGRFARLTRGRKEIYLGAEQPAAREIAKSISRSLAARTGSQRSTTM